METFSIETLYQQIKFNFGGFNITALHYRWLLRSFFTRTVNFLFRWHYTFSRALDVFLFCFGLMLMQGGG